MVDADSRAVQLSQSGMSSKKISACMQGEGFVLEQVKRRDCYMKLM